MTDTSAVHKGDDVGFHIRDVYLPAAAKVLNDLHGNGVLNGVIVDFSCDQVTNRTFGVVFVPRLGYHCLVACEDLTTATDEPSCASDVKGRS